MKQSKVVRDAIEYLDDLRARVLSEDDSADPWLALSTAEAEWIKGEIFHCRQDFEYAAGNYFWLSQTKSAKAMLLDLWDAQRLLYDIILNFWKKGQPAWILVHKARQLGLSTVVEGLMTWKALFYRYQVAMIIAQNPDHAAFMFALMQNIIAKVPWWMQPSVLSLERKEVLILDNDGRSGDGDGLANWIVANSANKMSSFGQGKPIHCLHITEASQWRPASRAREIIEGDLKYALVARPGCFAILESKPNGIGGYWHGLWKHYSSRQFEHGDAQFYPLFVPVFFEPSRRAKAPPGFQLREDEVKIRERYALEWHKCKKCGKPIYANNQESVECIGCGSKEHEPMWLDDDQLFWYRQLKDGVTDSEGMKKFLQEMAVTAEEGFQAHGIQVFPPDTYRWVQETAIAPRWFGEFDESFKFHTKTQHCPTCRQDHSHDDDMFTKIWEFPQAGCKYYAGVDVGYGDVEGDYSVIHLLKMGYGYPGRGGVSDTQVLEWRGRIAAEELARVCYILGKLYNNATFAIEAHGPGDMTQMGLLKMGYNNLFQWKHYDSSSHMITNKLGWWTNFQTKKMILTNGIRWLRQHIWKVQSLDFLHEMPTFVRDYDEEGAGGAVRGEHDDAVMAGLIAIFCAHDVDFNKDTGRIEIPSSYIQEYEDLGEQTIIWTCFCDCGNSWKVKERPNSNVRCPKCGRLVSKATRHFLSESGEPKPNTPKAYIDVDAEDAEPAEEYVY